MWVLEELVEGVKLSELINTTHENKKYLPGIKLPNNLLAVPDLNECVKDTDLFIFVIPHQFVKVFYTQLLLIYTINYTIIYTIIYTIVYYRILSM